MLILYYIMSNGDSCDSLNGGFDSPYTRTRRGRAVSKYGELEELSDHAASCAALTQALVAHIRVTNNQADQAAPELAERGRSLRARLRDHINKWNSAGKQLLREELQAHG